MHPRFRPPHRHFADNEPSAAFSKEQFPFAEVVPFASPARGVFTLYSPHFSSLLRLSWEIKASSRAVSSGLRPLAPPIFPVLGMSDRSADLPI